MAKEKTANNEVGIIGQMYEERKTGKVGVLEDREPKYKTLLFRDKEGKSFNINYSTFRSSWRKYQGEEVIQTSTQKEENKVEEKKKVEEAKKEVETVVGVRLTTEDKVKKIRALEQILGDTIKKKKADLKVSRKSKGGIVVCYKKRTMFEVWYRFQIDKIDIIVKEDLVALDRDNFDHIIKMTDYTYMDNWVLKHCCKTDADHFESVASEVIDVAMKFIESKKENEKPKKKEKNDKNEEE